MSLTRPLVPRRSSVVRTLDGCACDSQASGTLSVTRCITVRWLNFVCMGAVSTVRIALCHGVYSCPQTTGASQCSAGVCSAIDASVAPRPTALQAPQRTPASYATPPLGPPPPTTRPAAPPPRSCRRTRRRPGPCAPAPRPF